MYAFSFVLANFGIAIAARMPMITTTISSSMSVKPLRFIVISQMWSELPVPARSAIESLVRLHPFRANLMPCRRAVTTTLCACTGYGDDVFTLSHWATRGKSGFLQGSRPVATRFGPTVSPRAERRRAPQQRVGDRSVPAGARRVGLVRVVDVA